MRKIDTTDTVPFDSVVLEGGFVDDGIVVVIGFIDIIGSNVVVTVPFVLLSGACLISCVAPNFQKISNKYILSYF